MDCFDLMDTAKKYAHSIYEKYMDLYDLESIGEYGTKTYQQYFQELKNMVECEHLFYGFMEDYELDFIHERLIRDERVPESFTLIDLFVNYDHPEERKEWYRVYYNICLAKAKKDYPVLDVSTKQIGMIPLIPYESVGDYIYYLSKSGICNGCFDYELSRKILTSDIYPEEIQIYFKYQSSYCHANIETYYLNTQFMLKEEKVDSVLDAYQSTYGNDKSSYANFCYDLFSQIFVDPLAVVLQVTKEELQNLGEFYAIFVLFLADALAAFVENVPTATANTIYADIRGAKASDAMKNYFLGKIMPIVEEKKAAKKL